MMLAVGLGNCGESSILRKDSAGDISLDTMLPSSQMMAPKTRDIGMGTYQHEHVELVFDSWMSCPDLQSCSTQQDSDKSNGADCA